MVTRAQAKLIRKLKTRKRREEERAFLVEGVRLVEELLDSGRPVELVVVAPGLEATSRGTALRERLAAGETPVAETTDAELGRLADTRTPQGVLAVVRAPDRRLADFAPARRATVLVFDRLNDPGNLGTLLRTGHALGVDWAVALPGTVDPFNPKAVRASAGSIFRLPVSGEPWSDVMGWLRANGFTILCADPDGEPASGWGPTPERFALVVGNEPSGLDADVQADCDRHLAIELAGDVDSLNAAVAGALLLDRLLSRRPD